VNRSPGIRVIALTSFQEEGLVESALELGGRLARDQILRNSQLGAGSRTEAVKIALQHHLVD
jgi:hypothetical protein